MTGGASRRRPPSGGPSGRRMAIAAHDDDPRATDPRQGSQSIHAAEDVGPVPPDRRAIADSRIAAAVRPGERRGRTGDSRADEHPAEQAMDKPFLDVN